ncbi:MAG: FAD-dependent monooxygenase [Thermomicrobiaceae bacterium]
MRRHKYEILIAGAGVAGLTSAIALNRAGHTVNVFERQERIQPLGAGLILWSNAVKALRAINLEDALADIGQPLAQLSILDSGGNTLSQTDARLISEKARAATLAVHRADLMELLLTKLPAGTLHTGHKLTEFEQNGRRVTAHFADGSHRIGNILIGADGIWSTVRAQVHGDIPPRYSGYTAWRAVSRNPDIERFGTGHSTESWGAGARFGWVPLTDGRVYWFAVKNALEGQMAGSGGHRKELLELFGNWHSPIPETIEATPGVTILRNDIYDRPPIPNWGDGAVTLAGDAAHSMTPNTGQGAAQAIEDGVVLADCLNRYVTIEAALRAYERARGPRTRVITELSHRIGRMAQLENPTLGGIRNLVTKLTPDSIARRQIQEIVDWQAPILGKEEE